MAIYIALLRGVNVGGKKVMKMTELKNMLEGMGLERVQTYIQSGNFLFESNEDEKQLRKKIEKQFETVFGFQVSVVLRTAEELSWIMNNCPFSQEAITEAEAATDVECLYVYLMVKAPLEEGLRRWSMNKNEGDEYHVTQRDIYLLLHQGIRNSKLANNLYRMNIPATIRNWKTLYNLHVLAEEMKVHDPILGE